MQVRDHHSIALALFMLLCPPSWLAAQSSPEAIYQAKRQEAAELFDQGKRLEALPLLEELVQNNPKDDSMLVALAACLVDHAATITNEQAAGRERLRARDLLDKAWELGNTSPLAMNLSQLLHQLPASGSIQFSDNPKVQRFMQVGEAAFSRRDFEEALKNYYEALDLEPKNSSAALFIANTYDKQDNFAKAAEWYQRAIELDPNVETPYRYYADMLAKHADMVKARAMLIQAVVAEPYNRIVWRELRAWATLNDTQIKSIYVTIPATPNGQTAAAPKPNRKQLLMTSNISQAYQGVKTSWQQGGQFKHWFPEEKEYRHTLMEESEALTAAAKVLEKLKEDNETAKLLADDYSLTLLQKLHQAGLIESYVLFSLGDAGIARDYAAYRARNRKKLEEYMDKFVLPPAH